MDLKISRLSAIYGLSKSTIKRKFSKIKEQIPQKLNLKEVVVLCDASYWGKRYSFGVVVFKDGISKKILWWKFIYKKECINDYLDGIKYLQDCGYEIKAVVSDGLAGLAKSISPLPFQFCQYHMKKYRKKYNKQPKNRSRDKFASNHKRYVLSKQHRI